MKKLIATLLTVGLTKAAICQLATTNTGTLYVSGNTDIVHLSGNFTNSSTAALTNNGQFYIKGDFTNNQANVTIGTGTLHLNGSTAQAINGTQVFRTFNLVTNNSAGITLNNTLNISGTHTFTAGIIATSSTPAYLVYESGSSYTGANDTRHVSGSVRKLGATPFTFPVGNGTYLRSIGITGLSATAEVEARYGGVTTNTGNRELTLASVNSSEHWILNKISGGTAQVVMNWDHSKVPFPNYIMTDIRTAQYSTEWRSTGGSASGSVTGTGTITSNALSTFGPMVIGSVTAVVPVRFLNVTANRISNVNRVIWHTANEVALKHYELQRQHSGSAFTTIATVGATNLPEQQTYSYDDASVLTGKTYYRIKSVNRDGSESYSRIVSVQIDKESKITILQNPVRDKIELSAEEIPKAEYRYQIISSGGHVVQSGQLSLGGTQRFAIPFSGVASGSYLLSIISDAATPHLIRIIKH